jgi:hypothetical protein
MRDELTDAEWNLRLGAPSLWQSTLCPQACCRAVAPVSVTRGYTPARQQHET